MAEKEPAAPGQTSGPTYLKPPGMEDFGRRELARAYVPPQVYSGIMSPAEGLQKGTVFPELYQPYVR